MKKILSVLMAAIMLLSVFVVTSSAAKAPTITAAANASTAKVGDTVKVTVSTSKNSKICATTLSLEYNKAYFQVVNKTDAGAFAMVDFREVAGAVNFYAISNSSISDATTTLFTVEFKVLKTGGEIKFVAKEVYVVDENGADANVTNKISSKTLKIECSHQNKNETITRQPTCTDKGSKKTVCKDCGKDFGKTDIPAKGHNFESLKVVKQATCTEAGLKEGKCKNCSQKKTETIPAKGHTKGNWEVKTAPTCSKEGESVKKCTVCKAVVETRKDAKKPHTPGEWEVSVQATVGKPGTMVKKCTVCKAVVETKEYTATKPGDIDGNGTVTTIDARKTLQYAANNITLTPEQAKRADVNNDGAVTTIDARKVLQLAASAA